MTRLAIQFTATLVTMLVLDGVWLTLVAAPMYRGVLGAAMLPGIRRTPAILFYLLYAGGLVSLAELGTGTPLQAAGRGALLGLVAYGTFEFTNLAILVPWTWRLALTDLAWGTLLSAAAAGAGRKAATIAWHFAGMG